MSGFKRIPIQAEQEAPAGIAIAKALLHEIGALLERLVATGEGGTIDLRGLPPLGAEGYGFLKAWLAEGEVAANIHSLGHSEVLETAYPGVWWITHRNEKDAIVTELIEVAEVPALLKSQRDDIQAGLARLNGRLPSL
jgi:hydrogenase-1 operon protein HyaF